jgi:hypothetical protein
VVGTPDKPTLDVTPPAAWSSFDLPNLALSRAGSVEAWSSYESLGGYCLDGVAVSSRGPERLDCFTIGGDAAMYHKAWDGSTWSDWESLGGTRISAPAAVSWCPNRVDAFVIGPDHALYHQWWNGSVWSGWAENLGGYCVDGVAAAPGVPTGSTFLSSVVTAQCITKRGMAPLGATGKAWAVTASTA